MLTLTKKTVTIYILGMALLCSGLFCISKVVLADSYVVTASVPYEIPTQASIITTIGVTTTTASMPITGSCGIITPAAIVSLWNGASLLGATQCQLDGTFTVTVNLQNGLNTVIPKTSNIANVYGPDGQPILFTYIPPAPPPSAVVTESPATAGKPTVAPPALQVSSPQPFGVLSNAGEVSIDITVQGGDTPYEIVVKWGDGKSDNKTVSEAGTYTFTHVYKQSRNYTANVKVTDKSGNSSNILIPFSDVKGAIAQKVIPRSEPAIIEGDKITLSILVLAFVLVITAIGTFALGHLHQMQIHKKISSKKVSKKLSRR